MTSSNKKSEGKDYYLFVQCPSEDCRLRFPGVEGVPCPLCKSKTELVSDRVESKAELSPAPLGCELSFLLDNIRSVFNVGSIFRSAEGVGAKHLYLGGISPDPSHKAMSKTALGAQELLSYSSHNNSVDLALELVAMGKTLWALEYCRDSVDLSEVLHTRPKKDLVLVLGNEVTGVDPGVLMHCEKIVHLPMRGSKVSLNVATAAGVAAYWLCQ